METAPVVGGAAPTRSSTDSKRVIAAALGTVAEYYDLTVYGYVAVVISSVFFPARAHAALLATLSIFALSYLMRPIGGLILGRIGDRRGRQASLLLSIVLMGLGTLMMALLPSYRSVGLAAPVLLVVSRLIQGLSAGGEYGSAMTYVYESFGGKRRGLAVSFLTVALFTGTAMAAGVVGLVETLTTDGQMASWGWRIPFLVGVPLALACLWMRKDLTETSDFRTSVSDEGRPRASLRDLLRNHPRQLSQVVLISVSVSGASYMVLTYFVVHLQEVGHFARTPVSWITAGVILAVALVAPLAGLIVDRFGPIRTSVAGLLVFAVLAYPTLVLMSGHGLALAALFFLLFAMGTPLVQVSKDRLFPELFGTSNRTTGVALGFNIGVVISGGTAATICTWLVDTTGNPFSPAYFVLLSCAIGFVAIFWASRHRATKE